MNQVIKSIALGVSCIGSGVVTIMLLKYFSGNGFAEAVTFSVGAFLYVKLWECTFE